MLHQTAFVAELKVIQDLEEIPFFKPVSTSIPIDKIIYHRLEPRPEEAGNVLKMLRYFGVFISCLVVLLLLTGIESRSQSLEPDLFAAFAPQASPGAVLTNSITEIGPPPHTEYAKMARYLVHKVDWVSMGTLSTLDTIKGYPMVNIIAVADSARGAKSTGVLYFYLTMLDFTAQDLSKDNKLTILLSMDQDLGCSKRGVDPMEPTCARIMISGRAVKLEQGTDEFNFGKGAMFSRHPSAKKWLDTHDFFLCKLDITQIAVLDYYGGPHFVTVEDYMKANPDTNTVSEKQYSLPKSDSSNDIVHHSDDERTITVKLRRDSPVHHINLEV